jgi:hypothetical protein
MKKDRRCTFVRRVKPCHAFAGARPAGHPNPATTPSATGEPFLTGPPKNAGPVVVRASFHLRDINDIDDEAETFEFGGVSR